MKIKLHTYFIQSGEFVKIGKSYDVDTRMERLQDGSPLKLKLLFCDDEDREYYYHLIFSKYHYRGEWYYLSQEILQYIKDRITLKEKPKNDDGKSVSLYESIV